MANALGTVMIVRHAEKPDEAPGSAPPFGVDELGQTHPESLTPRGWQRAGAVAALFGAPNPPAPLGQPSVLLSPDYGPVTPSHRTTQTLTPLSRRLGVAIATPVAKGQEADLVRRSVLPADGDVLVCWEHHHIPDIVTALAGALGVGHVPEIGRTWPDDDFDSILVFTPTNSGYAATVVSQNALDGDGRS